jgi:5'-phosphate synthase pdxT subunit
MNPVVTINRPSAENSIARASRGASTNETALPRVRVGVLAIQGDFAMHRKMVESLGHECCEVRTLDELLKVDCLIMPGGESTTMRKILKSDVLWMSIPHFAKKHAIMGTCAGLILLGKNIVGARPEEDSLGLIDIDSDRSAYGSQYHSFRKSGEVVFEGPPRLMEMVFIRAPQITRIGSDVEVLGRLGETPTMVRQGNILALTFHPEMTEDATIHQFFIGQVVMSAGSRG